MQTLEKFSDVNLTSEQTGYVPIKAHERWPKVKFPMNTVACFLDVKANQILRIDELGMSHHYSLRQKEWTQWHAYDSWHFWHLYRNKGLRPVIFNNPQ